MKSTPLMSCLLAFALVGCAEITVFGSGEAPGTLDPAVVTDPDCPQAAHFPELSADPANSAWDAPQVEAGCTDTSLLVASNGIPAYEYVDVTPNGLTAQDYLWEVPRYPEVADAITEIPLLGTAGFAVNGLPIFGPNEAAFPDPYGDPIYNSIVDTCLGHTGQGGTYHYHALLVECVLMEADVGPDEPSPVIGYAMDGFPIYGPMECADAGCDEVVEMQSSWVQTGDPSTYAWDNYAFEQRSGDRFLDRCNGHVGVEGDYHYHATSTFPYVLGCYAGTPADSAGDVGGGESGGGGGNTGGGGQGQGDPPECSSVPEGQPCCGDDVCDGPETADNCPADCG